MTRLYLQYRPRIVFLTILASIFMTVIAGKLLYVQVICHDEYRSQAWNQGTEIKTVRAMRGNILARNGEALTANTIHYSFAVDPQVFKLSDSLATIMAETYDRSPSHYLKLMDSNRSFAWLERNVPTEDCQGLRNFSARGFIVRKSVRRHYPYTRLAAPLIGFTDVDNTGISGIELEYDSVLKGLDGSEVLRRDAKGKVIPLRGQNGAGATHGSHVQLTLDIDYQAIFQEEITLAYERLAPKGIQGVLMDPATGEILAIAQYPGFDPNRPWDSEQSSQRLKPLIDMYEPGSTLKVITATAALEESLYDVEDEIFCENGEYLYKTIEIEDTHPKGMLSLADIIAYSSNIGIIKIAEELGAHKLYRYYTRYGLGSRTGVAFSGESPGLLRPTSQWSNISIGELAMGQEIGVTTLQLAQIYSTIANGGLLIQPRLVKALISPDGQKHEIGKPEALRRVASGRTMAKLRRILFHSVEEGTGNSARIAGYKIAGKTGTAQKFVDGRYSETDFNATFAAMIPTDKPRLVCIVTIDSPIYGQHSGGVAAAPVVRNVFTRILHLDNDFYVPPQPPVAERRRYEPLFLATAATTERHEAPGVVPDFIGSSLRKAIRLARNAGLRVQVRGSGNVVSQSLEPGLSVDDSAVCILTLHEDLQ
ncbi:MAG: transpeptidase family protein [Candidatus Marinimicrobia bacterium]|nr:transpeptidase family protein [Candidatus Neomarinimicrobiota bacterium]